MILTGCPVLQFESAHLLVEVERDIVKGQALVEEIPSRTIELSSTLFYFSGQTSFSSDSRSSA